MDHSIAAIFRAEHGRVMAAVVKRTSGDFDLAEEAVQHAFTAAVSTWGDKGVPDNPQAWLMRVARNRAIDIARKDARHRAKEIDVADSYEEAQHASGSYDGDFGDDRLRLIFTCCHPALSLEAQVALTLRTVCGLETDDIAHAFLVAPTTMAQRLVRAKKKIRAAKIPYRVPEPEALAERTAAVATVIYLVFNAGYSAPERETANVDTDLCGEAEWLARLVVKLLPGDRELLGLLALVLLHGSRKKARRGEGGEMVLLEDQDRSQWDGDAISEGRALVVRALRGGPPGAYAVQAAIAAVHAEADSAETTDWKQIVGLYNVLLRVAPTPVVELNRAVAVAMADGPSAGLALLENIEAAGKLGNYHLFHAARADLFRRLDRRTEAQAAYREAIARTDNSADRQFLSGRLRALMES